MELHETSHMVQNELEGVKGYEAMQKAEKLSENNKDIHYVGVDDNSFSNSALLLVEHKSEERGFMGVSITFIPQLSNKGELIHFFLYPNHLDNLENTLRDIKSKIKEHNDGFLTRTEARLNKDE